ncbi:MAG: GNAT family N-acetyltransferase [Nitrospira sp.]|nr:GNAT family N-acetyltransferase [Nitrospira sp.]
MTRGKKTTGRIETTVTYLEMTERPTRPSTPVPAGKLAIFRAEQPTVSFYRYMYDTVGEPWNWTDRRRLTDDELTGIIHDPDVAIYILYVAGVPAGFVELDGRIAGAVELSYVGLMPEFVGRGLGSYLLDWAVSAAWLMEPKRVWLHTCSLDHPSALPMYRRAGFVPYDQQIETVAALD